MDLESNTGNRLMVFLSLSGIVMSIATILIILYSMQYIQNQRDLLRGSFDSYVRSCDIRFDNDERRISEVAHDMHQRIGAIEQFIIRNGGSLGHDGLHKSEHGSPSDDSRQP